MPSTGVLQNVTEHSKALEAMNVSTCAMAVDAFLPVLQVIEAKYNMRSQFEWDRFIRFMDRWGMQQIICRHCTQPNSLCTVKHFCAFVGHKRATAWLCPLLLLCLSQLFV